MTRDDGLYLPVYDVNGNINGYVNASGAIAAKYEYSPFGEIISQTGGMADEFMFRFSSKYFEKEAGLYNYGYRYLWRDRWLNRDPIQEKGGLNLYGFVLNNPVLFIDPFGDALPLVWGGCVVAVKKTSPIWGPWVLKKVVAATPYILRGTIAFATAFFIWERTGTYTETTTTTCRPGLCDEHGTMSANYVVRTTSQTKTETQTKSQPKPCPPCIPPVGMPFDLQIHTDHPHFPCPKAHWHYLVNHQSPDCICFPKRMFGGCL